MTPLTADRRLLLFLTVAGFCSALLTVKQPVFGISIPPGISGLLFGFCISAAIYLGFPALRVPWRLLGFAVVCAFAELISLFMGIGIYFFMTLGKGTPTNSVAPVPSIAIFTASAFGAFLVLMAAEAFFGSKLATRWNALCFFGFPLAVGGLVAVAASSGFVWSRHIDPTLNAILVWEPTVALLIGLNMLRDQNAQSSLISYPLKRE